VERDDGEDTMILLPIHILGGMFALLFGYTALYAAKGAALHRKSGTGFVIAMIAMSLTGVLMSVMKFNRGNMLAGSLTFYFVVTGLLAVKPIARARPIETVAMFGALILGVGAIWAGFWLAGRGRPEAGPMFLFSAMAILGAFGDWKMLRAGGLIGRARIKRHLWRLCFAMWVAAASFFWGPPNRVPEFMRVPALFPIPVLTPIVVMLYWLWRMRRKREVRGIVTAAPLPEFDHAMKATS
jgi:uncharacterized membrane protein